jgi:hypothetical protein
VVWRFLLQLVAISKTLQYCMHNRTTTLLPAALLYQVNGGIVALDFIFERDWPVIDESDWWW